MNRKAALMLPIAVLLLAGLFMPGCGPKPPCDVQTQQVEGARADLQEAQFATQAVQAEVETLEQEVQAATGDLRSEEELAVLKARLEELKKGSGR